MTEHQPSDNSGQAILDRLLLAHEAYFDIERDHAFAGRIFPGYAELHSSSSQYVLVKRAKLWETSSHEYMFFTLTKHLDARELDELVGFMTNEALEKVVLDKDHMNSYLTLVVVAESIDEGIGGLVKKTRFRKNFSFGLKGWVDLRLCVIDLERGTIYANAPGKEIVPTLEANAFGLDAS